MKYPIASTPKKTRNALTRIVMDYNAIVLHRKRERDIAAELQEFVGGLDVPKRDAVTSEIEVEGERYEVTVRDTGKPVKGAPGRPKARYWIGVEQVTSYP